jgi:hypothetical protein
MLLAGSSDGETTENGLSSPFKFRGPESPRSVGRQIYASTRGRNRRVAASSRRCHS